VVRNPIAAAAVNKANPIVSGSESAPRT
jgi:hypothetical protein